MKEHNFLTELEALSEMVAKKQASEYTLGYGAALIDVINALNNSDRKS